jgi:hypothetical protein
MVILYFTERLEVSVEHCVSLPVAIDNIQFKLHSLNTHMYISTHRTTMFSLSRQNLHGGGLHNIQVMKQ